MNLYGPIELPQPDYKTTVNYADGSNADIIATVHKNFPAAVAQTKNFARRFKGANHTETARNIWNFLKQNIQYTKDTPDAQLIRLPSRFIADGKGDCKSYALTAAALLANNGMPVAFRYANYMFGTIPSHIYTISQDESGNEIIVDGVWNKFNSEKKPTYKFDRIMRVETLSGTETAQRYAAPDTSDAAFQIFLPKYLSKRPKAAAIFAHLAKNNPERYQRRLNNLRAKWVRWQQNRIRRGRLYKGRLSEIITGIELDSAIGKFGFFKKIFKGIKKIGKGALSIGKKIALAPARRAFRTLVALNFKGLAKKLARVDAKDRASLDKKWKQVGGSPGALRSSIKAGYNRWAKKHGKGPMTGIYGCDLTDIQREAVAMGICGPDDDGIGALPAILALAGAVFAALAPLLRKHGEDPNAPEAEESKVDNVMNTVTDAVESYNAITKGAKLPADDPTNAENSFKYETQPGTPDTPLTEEEATDGESGTGFKLGPVPIIAIAAGAFLLLRKK